MPEHDHRTPAHEHDRRPWRAPALSRLDTRRGTHADQYGLDDEDDFGILAS